MKEKILVTGGAGYIGSILVNDLLKNNFEVTVIDNFFYNQTSLLNCSKFKKLNIINDDIRNYTLLNELIKKHDIIIPLAGLVGAPLCKKFPKESHEINYDAAINIFKNKVKDQRLIMPTTNSAYGSGNQDNYCDENSPLKPISEYAKQKVDLEQIMMQGDNVTSLRLATVFGVSPRPRLDLLVNDFTFRAIRDNSLVLYESHFKRNYIHVRDISKCFQFCISNDKTINEIFNVGLSDTNISKLELANRIKKYIPSLDIQENNEEKDPDQRNYIVSNTKIESVGFTTDCSLDDGIKEIIRYYPILKNNNFNNI